MNTTPLKHLLATFRQAAHSEREKGAYFEELVRAYFRHEASYADLFAQVWLYADFRVVKMRFGKKKDPETGKSVPDRTTVVYNPRLTIRNIPLAAYDYIVNGKPALEWVIERQSVTTDKDSGIVNDANLYATETMHNPKYPLELFQRVITVSLETMNIVNALPGLDID